MNVQQADRPSTRPASPSAPRRAVVLVGISCGIVTLGWLLAVNWQLITTPIIEDSDFAANSILVERAEEFRLLIGNYSRLGFNHPGPALLYAQAIGSIVVHDWLGLAPSSYGGQFVGIMVLNSVCVGVACGIARAVTGRWAAALGLLALLPLINVWEPYSLATTWMPGAYIAPFLLMVVAAAAVAGAQWSCLWALVAGASLCVHGHVSFVMFAAVTAVVSVGVGLLRVRAGAAGPTRRQLIAAAAVLVLFLLPIAANLVLHWPGELAKYLSFAGAETGFAPRTAGDVAAFTGSFWVRSGGWTIALFGLSALLVVVSRVADPRDPGARFRLDVVLACLLETVVFAFYAARGVDDLSYHYVGWFLLVCPMLVLWAGLATLLGGLQRRLRPRTGSLVAAAVCAALGVLTLAQGVTANPYRGLPPALADALPKENLRLNFHLAGWQPALGLLVHSRREGFATCVEGQMWAFLVTPAMICPADGSGRPILILGPGEQRPPDVIYDDGTTAIVGL